LGNKGGQRHLLYPLRNYSLHAAKTRCMTECKVHTHTGLIHAHVLTHSYVGLHTYIHSTVNFVDWQHSGAVMHYSEYVSIHTHMHRCIHTYIRTYIHTYIMHAYIHTYIHA
jgi:hypothetical protein